MAVKQDKSPTEVGTLDQLAVGSRARITDISANRFIVRRLLGLGLRKGSEISVLHHRRKSVVVAVDGNRIALGDGVTDKLHIELIGPLKT